MASQRIPVALVLALAPLCLTFPAIAAESADVHFSPLKQINRGNAGKLHVAWQYDSGDQYDGSEMQCNPLVKHGVLYATTPRLRIIALDAATGKLLWDFDAHRGQPVGGKQRNRGLSYWEDGTQRRIFVGIDHFIYALDAVTGKPADGFGENGRVDLRKGLGEGAEALTVQATSPGVVYKDLLIQGCSSGRGSPGRARSHSRLRRPHRRAALDFHTIPSPGEYGYDTWPKDAWKRIGGANSWAGLTLDAQRGIVFVPTGSAAFDFYGANRVGDNLFANCMLALNAETGRRVWHFQFVHHDVWDRDLPAAPALVSH